jgi:hypothetical protein
VLDQVNDIVESILSNIENIPLSLLNCYNLKRLGAWSSLQCRRFNTLLNSREILCIKECVKSTMS